MVLVHLAHRIRKSIVPWAEVLDRNIVGITLVERFNQAFFDRTSLIQMVYCVCYRQVCVGETSLLFVVVEVTPFLVVVGSTGIGHAPVRHHTGRVVFECFPETLDRFLVVIAIGP